MMRVLFERFLVYVTPLRPPRPLSSFRDSATDVLRSPVETSFVHRCRHVTRTCNEIRRLRRRVGSVCRGVHLHLPIPITYQPDTEKSRQTRRFVGKSACKEVKAVKHIASD